MKNKRNSYQCFIINNDGSYKVYLYLLPLFVLAMLIISCSSQPGYYPSPIVSEADTLYRLGKQFSLQGQYENSLRSYQLAFDRYTSVDHLEGIILTKIAIIGTTVKSGDFTVIDKEIAELTNLIEVAAPRYKPHLLLLNTEITFLRQNYRQVITLTSDLNILDTAIQSQLLCYRLMALLKYDQPANSEYRQLRNNSKTLQKLNRKRRISDTGTHSYVNYILGYYNIHNERWKQAQEYFRLSLLIDRENDYRNGIGQNLYYIALTYEKLENLPQAKIHYERAMSVFQHLNNEERIKTITDRLAGL